MKEKLKNTKGITLVALVITIIVLLILATVTIRLVLSEGIIKRAENAVSIYNDTQSNELAQLNDLEEKMVKYTGGEITEVLIPTDTEKNSFSESSEGMKKVADKDQKAVEIQFLGDDLFLAIETGEKAYFYCITEGAANYLEGVTANQWYSADNISNFDNTEIYNGTSPISLSDFDGGTIYSESYLKKVINSFNK